MSPQRHSCSSARQARSGGDVRIPLSATTVSAVLGGDHPRRRCDSTAISVAPACQRVSRPAMGTCRRTRRTPTGCAERNSRTGLTLRSRWPGSSRTRRPGSSPGSGASHGERRALSAETGCSAQVRDRFIRLGIRPSGQAVTVLRLLLHPSMKPRQSTTRYVTACLIA
jgi:hypothetical protein